MTEPRRLKDEGDELERMLLGSAAADAPSAASRAAAMQALGLSTKTPSKGSGPGSGPAVSVPVSGATLAVIGAIGVGALVLILAAWPAGDAPATRETPSVRAPIVSAGMIPAADPTQSGRPGSPGTPVPVAEPVVVPPVSLIAPEVALEAPVPAARGPRRTADLAPAPSPDPASSPEPTAPVSIGDELAIIDSARASIRASDASAALALLDDHDRRYPSGPLMPEAQVARIEALVRAGDLARATPLARRFLAQHPTSTAVRRVRQLVPGAEDAPSDDVVHP